MLEPVKVGEPIKAQQYNELLGALAGPNAPSNGVPFTQTKAGSLFNGGHTRYNTRESYHYNDFMSITYSSGTVDDRFDCYDANNPDMNIFDGVWFQTPHFSKSEQYFYHSQFFGQPVETFLIDPTTDDDDLKLIWMLTGAKEEESGMWPLCEISAQASLGVFQIMECTQYTDADIGRTIAIFGNWKKLDSAVEGWQVKDAFSGKETQLLGAIKSAQPALRTKLTRIRFVGQFPMYDNYDALEGTNYDLPPVAFNVGQQTIESLPDAAQDQESQLSVTELSSIEFTPAHSWGFPSGNQATWGYSLFNFARYASDSLSTVYDEETHRYVPELSAYDILLKHKHPHSKSNTGNPYYGGQANAVLEYISLSSLKDILDDVKVDTTETNLAQCSIEKNDLSDDKEFLQLYHFNIPGVDNTLHVNLNFGETRWVRTDGGSGTYPDPNVQFIIRDSSNNVEVQYDDFGIFLPHVNASDVIDLSTVISDYVHCECSCDLESIWAALSGLSNDLSNYWKVDGDYADNCHGYSIGDSSANPQIHLDEGQLLYSNDQDPTLDWHNGYLQWNNGEIRLNWPDCNAFDKNQGTAIDWDYRHLYDAAGNVAVRWSDRILHDSNQMGALDWDYRTLYDSGLNIVADWERKQLLDTNTIPAVDWSSRILYDSNNGLAENWYTRELSGDWTVHGHLTVSSGHNLQIGNTTLSESQLIQLLSLI